MSVLNQSGEEQVECPLCMEPLEVDDLNFYPCTCGYQICRFCWHRIRTDENGLCPACRKAYSENPADFTPLSKEQVAQLKAEKRQRDQQRKAKLSESRKHLASVRVVQKNLVFVVGLPVRLADADVLKRHEYFGKFGKIHKVVINQSTSYAGSQGPSASAYVTYCKSDDALRAIQNVNNITLDGRLIKSSLGTTKYCSHFMKNQPCPKADCMYLHDFGDPEASFTKEQMHLGKHQEYEKKLHDGLLSRAAAQLQSAAAATNGVTTTGEKSTASQPLSTGGASPPAGVPDGAKSKQPTGQQKEQNNWPTLSTTDTNGFTNTKTEKPQKSEAKSEKSQKKSNNQKTKNNNNSNSMNNNLENSIKVKCKEASNSNMNKNTCEQTCQNLTEKQTIHLLKSTQQPPISQSNNTSIKELVELPTTVDCLENLSKMQLIDDNSSFFSHNSFQKLLPDHDSSSYDSTSSSATPHSAILNDNLPDINSSEDWQAAFGFGGALKPQNGATTPQAQSQPIDTRNTPENGFTRPIKHGLTEMLSQLEAEYQKSHNSGNGFVDHSKQRDSILDVLAGRHFGAPPYKMEPNERLGPGSNGAYSSHHKLGEPNGLINGLDQQMSKFFAEFTNKHSTNPEYLQSTNGFLSNLSENNRQGYHNNSETPQQQQHNLLVYQQRYLDKQLEEHALFNLKQNGYNSPQQQQQYIQQQQLQQQQHHNSSQQFLTNGDHYLNQNGQNYSNPPYSQNAVYQNQTLHQQRNQVQHRERSNVDDDLGFDPFHETQKALAELIESEQGVSQLQQASNLLNQSSLTGHSANGTNSGPVHGGAAPASAPGNCLPPPPGFMQHNSAHMNSFGSKILPFLNMSSSQQINSSGGWTTYSEAHLKGLAPVNDWTTLDPAIVSSSRHFPLANLQPLRSEQYSPFQAPQQQQQQQQPLSNGGPMRGYDYSQTNGYTTNTFGNNITPQQQHNLQTYANGYATHLNQTSAQNGLNWYSNDLHGQISSPPGFRQNAAAASKTQEC